DQTRCTHYHSQVDIIAIKFKCCKKYYPCYKCHQAAEIHTPQVWSVTEQDQKAILCGVCKHELTIAEYLNSGINVLLVHLILIRCVDCIIICILRKNKITIYLD